MQTRIPGTAPAITLHKPALTLSTIVAVLTTGLALSAPVQAFEVTDRWSNTATDGNTGSQGDTITVTWGLVADGTTISGSEGSSGSDLISFLDTQIGVGPGGSDLTQRPWFSILDGSFSRLDEVSGVTYVYESNNTGQAINFTANPRGRLGTRPDVRIGGHSIDGQSGSNTLAYNYFPNHSDMVIDTDNTSFFSNSTNAYRAFRNVFMHEAGHGLGISHMESNNAAFLMEPFINTSFDGPQLDDILALQRNYGDALEKSVGNDTFGTATDLGSATGGGTLSIGAFGDSTSVSASQTDFVSIDDNSDTDYFSFTLADTLEVMLDLVPRGATYNEGPQDGTQTSLNTKALSDLTLALLDTNGTTVLDLASANGAGAGESITHTLTAGTYFARVTGANSNVQLYGLDISGIPLVPALPGDFEVDGDVDGADFLELQRGLGTIYDATDLAFWEMNFGMGVPPLSADSATTVPEPNSLALLCLSGLLALRRFRRATAFTA